MAAEQFFLPFPTAFSSNGLPEAGAKVYFYLTGTTTPSPIYQDAALTTEHTNPVVADSAARLASIYLDDTVTYKVEIKDADGNTLGTAIDPYIPGVFASDATLAAFEVEGGAALVGANDASSGAKYTTVQGFISYLLSSVGSSIVGFIQAGTGAVARTLQDKGREVEVTPEDFGAVGSNATLDGPAIQAAINRVNALGGGRVSFKAKNYITNQELTLYDNVELVGEGKKVSTITAGASLLRDNIISATGLTGIRIRGIGFIGLNLSVTPNFATTAKENLLYFMSCTDIIIEDCHFNRALNRTIYFDASVGSPMRDITIRNCELENGSRGGIFVVRYATNIYIHNNKMTDVVNSVIGGITFEKSISLTGTTNGYIYENTVVQTNTDSASIIAEYTDTASENIHIFRNTVTYDSAQVADNCIKAGAVAGLKVHDNVCTYAYASGVYLEGCINYEVYGNDISLCGNSGIVVISDASPTTDPSIRGKIFRNIITDCNQNAGATGTVGSVSGAVGSYAIYIEATSSQLDIYRNTFIDSGNQMNGIYIVSSTYKITHNDFSSLNSARITINNNSAPSTTWLIRDNKGCQTTDQGKATMADATNSISVVPDIVVQFDPNVQATPKAAYSGTVAYSITAPDTPPQFVIQTKTSGHATANVVGALEFNWSASFAETAKGIFGKTTR